ncbi:hypothetical protein AABB24_026547 [Solanum stoloniferum]|uniref:Tryptophan synthase beta chain-like PALP domain-containing protein n=1 Tax=Solanum stoloniferum TaxID=62892 RepID=A0ABD2SFD9_9SOLN
MLSCQWSSFTRISVSPFPLQQGQLNKVLNLKKQCCVTKSSMDDSTSHTHQSPFQFLTKKPYEPPPWASHLSPIPSHTFSLGHFPTPIHKWNLPNLPKNTEVWLKRDDMSGMQLSGNKVRKLEFLLADAVAQGADCIVTIGGIQSNHCRATAVAAKYLNLDCYLILRTSKLLVDKDPGLTGNLLVDRLVGAHIDLVSKEEYAKVGSECYVSMVSSGGTVAGLSIASMLSGLKAKINAFCVCDDPDYFYEYVQGLLDGITAGVSSRDIVSIETAKGLGYAMSTADELKFVKQVAKTTGVILDPVYSGKAAYGMMKDMSENPTKWEGRKIMFIHTGGLLGLYDKADEIGSLMGKWRKMDIDESIPRQDGIGKMF